MEILEIIEALEDKIEHSFTIPFVGRGIIDKDTLMPSDFFSSVTIITPDSGLADALSTALFAMSYEDGRAIVESLENIEVLWITQDGTQYYTDGLAAMLRQ